MLLKCADGGLPAAGLVCADTSPDVSPDPPRCYFLLFGGRDAPSNASNISQTNAVKHEESQ